MPATIPTVVLTVQTGGTVIVTMDGTVLPPPANTVWRRSSLPESIDQATDHRTVAVWIEINETDGSSFTDLIPALGIPTPAPSDPARSRGPRRAKQPKLHEVRAEGFVPGEDVAIALVTGYTDATGDGLVRTLIDTSDHPEGCEVVLVGRIFGTMAIRRLG
ncbi:hypothetical protein [Bifidobacterium subtile]|uniref:hypothetical protein n=1 Tax=Bifidobacterium subtile TaxID=77635 RepID=UPI002F35AC57